MFVASVRKNPYASCRVDPELLARMKAYLKVRRGHQAHVKTLQDIVNSGVRNFLSLERSRKVPSAHPHTGKKPIQCYHCGRIGWTSLQSFHCAGCYRGVYVPKAERLSKNPPPRTAR